MWHPETEISITGICPETDEEQDILVTFIKVPVSGTARIGYVKDMFTCEYQKEYGCKYNKNLRKCPIYQRAYIP